MYDDIFKFYNDYDEDNRLRTRHQLEFLRSKDIILRNIPRANSRIIDIGGGAGIYSMWLSGLGHDVSLLDLIPKHAKQAKEHSRENGAGLASIVTGDAQWLSYRDSAFDIALLMGPLYHTLEMEKRLSILREAARVLRPQGIVIAAGISRYAALIDGLKHGFSDDEDLTKMILEDLDTGRHRNDSDEISYFTRAYFHHPEELKSELIESGFTLKGLFGVESIGSLISDVDERLSAPGHRDRIMELLRKVESEPSMIGASLHLMAVGIKSE